MCVDNDRDILDNVIKIKDTNNENILYKDCRILIALLRRPVSVRVLWLFE